MGRIGLILVFLFMAISALGQSFPSPYEKAMLDLYYRLNTSQIDGADIIDGTIPIDALAFVIITNETDPIFVAWLPVWAPHTNNASAHHVKFTNAEETDPVHTNWHAGEWADYTNLHAGVSGIYTQLLHEGYETNLVTNVQYWYEGSLTNWTTNDIEVVFY